MDSQLQAKDSERGKALRPGFYGEANPIFLRGKPEQCEIKHGKKCKIITSSEDNTDACSAVRFRPYHPRMIGSSLAGLPEKVSQITTRQGISRERVTPVPPDLNTSVRLATQG